MIASGDVELTKSSLPTRATTIWNTSGKGMRCANRSLDIDYKLGRTCTRLLARRLCGWGRHRWRWEYPGDSPNVLHVAVWWGMTKMRGVRKGRTLRQTRHNVNIK
jgi:hypothetical protein